MSAARDTKDREEMTKGAACIHYRCTRKYKRGRYMEAQIRRLQQLREGERTLCSAPVSQRDDARMKLGGPQAASAIRLAAENIWEAMLEWERGRPEPRL